jgi:cytochrome c-type biogenesis protein CcmF
MLDFIYYSLLIYLFFQCAHFIQSFKTFKFYNNFSQKNNNINNIPNFYQKANYLDFILMTFLLQTITLFIINFLQTNTLSYLIYRNSNILQFFFYKLSNFWNNHEGSFLLICVLIVSFKQLVKLSNFFSASYSRKVGLLYSLSFLEIFFFIILICVNNPFLILEQLRFKQIELNPILQDWLLLIHPPILYIGYIGISLLWFYSLFLQESFQKENKILFWIWSILTLGICLGSFWAYHELGWGGWWFWDPVENISLIPWIWLTLSFHMQNIKHRQVIFGIAFFGNIFGTFVIRAGLLNSVHSFVNDDNKVFFLISLLINLFFFFVMFINYKINYQQYTRKNIYVRLNNIFFYSVLILIILGTFLPMFFSFNMIIKPSYFNSLLTPLCFIFYFWLLQLNKAYFKSLFYTNTLLFLYLINCLLDLYKLPFFVLLSFLFLIFISVYNNIFSNRNRFYFQLIHLGWISLFLILLLNNYLNIEFLKIIKPGDIINIQNYKLLFRNIHFNIFSNYNSNFANFLIKDSVFNNFVTSNFFSEKRFYYLSNVYTSKNNIKSNFLVDIHCFLNSGNIFDGWLFKINYKPFVIYIWILIILNITYTYWFFYYNKKNQVTFSNPKYFVKKYFE